MTARGCTFPRTFEPDLFTPHDVAGVRRLTAILSPKPVAMPDFIARAALRKLERNAWVLRRSMQEMTGGRDLLDFRLYGITQPMLISWGSKDELIPLAVGETMHKDVPHSVLQIIDGCGHLAPAQCSGPVIEGTVKFLRAQPPLEGGESAFDRARTLRAAHVVLTFARRNSGMALVGVPLKGAGLGKADVGEDAIGELAGHVDGVAGWL